ncbi:MAG: DUF3015 domain-containing protein [Pseudomonadota bacterium]|nr:DUF3015 domain-containing protein [Pseudomonadota bacterium]
MRSLLIAILALGAVTGAQAKDYGPAGCGLGTEVIFKDANEWHEHVLAATTNGTSGNQTFGMTSGTLGCDTNGPLANGVGLYMEENLDQIAADAAQGHGENLDALAELIGVQGQDQVIFQAQMQNNFDAIFASEGATSQSSYEALVSMMRSDATLSKYVG